MTLQNYKYGLLFKNQRLQGDQHKIMSNNVRHAFLYKVLISFVNKQFKKQSV